MKIIVNGFHGSDFSLLVKKLIDNNAVDEILYLGTNESKENYADIEKIKYLDCGKISWGNYPDDPLQMPLDRTIIEENYETESYCLRMMDRLEFCQELTYSQRKEIYLSHLKYWSSIIAQKNICAFISSNLPHEIYDFVIYSLCIKKKINTILFHQTQLLDRYICVDDIFSFNYCNDGLTDENLYKNSIKLEKENYIDTLFKKMRQEKIPKPFYMKTTLKRSIHPKTRQLIKAYDRISVYPDYSKPYVFLALHYQPELTTSPLAGCFVDQLLMIDVLSYCLPDGVLLYVKEHPKQTHIGRSTRMYDAIKGYENVRTIRLDTDSSELIDHSIAVSTATGTVGWESLFRNKPVLMFGDFFYKKSPGVYRINDIDQCKKALQEILDSKYEFPKDGHKNFIEKLLDSSFYGYVDPAYKDHQSLSEPDNCEVLNSIISSRLRES